MEASKAAGLREVLAGLRRAVKVVAAINADWSEAQRGGAVAVFVEELQGAADALAAAAAAVAAFAAAAAGEDADARDIRAIAGTAAAMADRLAAALADILAVAGALAPVAARAEIKFRAGDPAFLTDEIERYLNYALAPLAPADAAA